jgi:AcrR family transcriptional regulator
MEAKINRQLAVTDARRGLILAASQRVLNRLGIERASMREIAAEAGYTPGAIYGYFAGKQSLMLALLDSMLDRLSLAVEQSSAPKGPPEMALVAKGRAWLRYFEDNPLDRNLLLKFCSGSDSLSLDGLEGSKIRVRIKQTFEPLMHTEPLSELVPEAARSELEAICTYALGLLLSSGTLEAPGPGSSISDRFEIYLSRLSRSLRTPLVSDSPEVEKNVTQMDMFG